MVKKIFYIDAELKYDFLRLIESRDVDFVDINVGEFVRFSVYGTYNQMGSIIKDWDAVKVAIETNGM